MGVAKLKKAELYYHKSVREEIAAVLQDSGVCQVIGDPERAARPAEIEARLSESEEQEIEFNSVLHDSHDEDNIHLKPLAFPQPMQGLAVETKKKSDEQRLFDVLHKLEIEDPCFTVERHVTTNETVIRGLGEMHLRAKLACMAQ